MDLKEWPQKNVSRSMNPETIRPWVKLKLKQTDEAIVGGFVPSGNSIDKLIVGNLSEISS